MNIPDSLFLATSLEPTAREVSSLLAIYIEDLLGVSLTPTVYTSQTAFTLVVLGVATSNSIINDEVFT